MGLPERDKKKAARRVIGSFVDCIGGVIALSTRGLVGQSANDDESAILSNPQGYDGIESRKSFKSPAEQGVQRSLVLRASI